MKNPQNNNNDSYNYKKENFMKSFLANKRSKAILGISILAISIGTISKKVISYPTGGCLKGAQELTLKQELKDFLYI